jgi:ligand-binding sensor domain-containing protein
MVKRIMPTAAGSNSAANLLRNGSKTSWCLSILLILSACRGQAPPASPGSFKQASASGQTVTKIYGGATVVFQDKSNRFWFAGNDRGVYQYDGKTLVLYTTEDGLCSPSITGVQEDQLGNIYFDTPEGVCQFDGQKFTGAPVATRKASEREGKLTPDDLWFRMGWDSDGPYRLVGDSLYQLVLPKTEQADQFAAEYPNASFNPYGIYSLYQDSRGYVWIGTSSLGVCRYDGQSISWLYEEQMTMTPSGGALGIRSVLEDQAGYFWFTNTRYRYAILPGSTERNGTSYLNYQKEAGIGYAKANGEIDYPYFMSLVEDHDGDLWMVTYSEGVWRNTGKELIHYPILADGEPVLLFSIYKDRQGGLWLGTHEAGVYRYTGKGFEEFEF